MNVKYCDLCTLPIKNINTFILYMYEPRESDFQDEQDYNDYMKKVQQNTKEVCPTCKQIFDKIFELRLARLSELADELNKIYQLPDNNEKKKKK